jgi:6-phosphogluconate dehydrogenase (decarboxylating)
MALTAQQKRDASAYWVNQNFVFKQILANYSLDDIQAAATSIDNAFDTTINQAQTAGFGNMTVIQAINANIPAPFNGASLQQKIELACHVLMKRAGII